MTLAASPNFVVYDGDAINTAFGYSYAINTNDGSDIQVWVIDNNGVGTLLTSNYTVDVFNALVNYPTVGGVLPLLPGINFLPAGWEIVLIRIEPISQDLDLVDQGPFSADAVEAELDKITMILQQLQEQINRAFKVPVGSTISTTDLSVFIAAISATFPPFSIDTYANLKILSAGSPTTKRWGYATDLNAGQGQLCFYTAIPTTGDGGWLLIPIEFFGG